MSPALAVTLHDVSPRNLALCRTAAEALLTAGVTRYGLLAIPADPAGPLEPDGAAANWLRQQAAAGHEVIQHGYYHRCRPGELLGWRQSWLNRVMARGAGEFLALDEDEAGRRLAAGRECLEAAALAADGFIAPAWLYSEAACRAVRRLGFRYYVSKAVIHDLREQTEHRSISLCNRSGPRCGDWTARRLNELLCGLQSQQRLVRVALHPADLMYQRPFEHTLGLIRALLDQGRQAVTYQQYLEALS